MLSIEDIKSYYTQKDELHLKNMLKEYIQCKILEVIFKSNISKNLAFIGGTALRIIHNTQRFSEDLDFDSFGLEKTAFEGVSEEVKKMFELEGCNVEIKTQTGGAVFHYHIKVPDLLFINALSPHKNEKILIKVDVQAQNINYTPDKKLLQKFDILSYANVAPLDILLSMKISAIFTRKRPMGRDFYDMLFLCSKTKPNYEFLEQKLKINNSKKLKNLLLEECKKLDFNELAKDLEPLIFASKDLDKIIMFKDFIKDIEL